MRVIVFTDLDDTLMATARKQPAGAMLMAGTLPGEGTVPSYLNEKQAKLWQCLVAHADVRIPVTARSAEGFAQVALSFKDGHILDFGLSIYTAAGVRDAEWDQEMAVASRELAQADYFAKLHHEVRAEFGASLLRNRIRTVASISCFLNARVAIEQHPALYQFVVNQMAQAGVAENYYLHVTDRDVTVLPRFVNKAAAVRRVIAMRGYHQDLTLGLGDSMTDVGFLQECAFQLLPTHSHAARALALVAEGI